MKIGELLELTQSKKLAEIAKESLEIGEKKTVAALKKAGCYSLSGKRGWHFDGDSSVLEQSIYEYSTPSQRGLHNAKAKANVPTNHHKERTNQPSNVPAKEQIEQANKQVAPTKEVTKEPRNEQTNMTTNVIRKRSSFDIDVELMKDLKIQAILHDRNVYEIVETAVRKYLKELKKD
ncbi:hypothetical protein MZM54_33110 [[Brevibacterium] frigoritolerans]|nr:hypothetical protein [Peribacillus frigoritolerans]